MVDGDALAARVGVGVVALHCEQGAVAAEEAHGSVLVVALVAGAVGEGVGVFPAVVDLSGEGDLVELCELIPMQVQNAGALYGLMKIFSEEEAR